MGGCPLRPGRRWLTCRCGARGGRGVLNPGGTCSPCRCGVRREGLPSLSPVAPAFTFFFAPYPPDRARRALFPGGEGGDFLVYFAGGFAPGTPALNRLRLLQSLPSRYPAAEIRDLPQKRQEAVPYEQCRQPRRGGTGGEELRRLRWSSPPGQVEPVPLGFSPLRTPQRQGQQVPPPVQARGPGGFAPGKIPQNP